MTNERKVIVNTRTTRALATLIDRANGRTSEEAFILPHPTRTDGDRTERRMRLEITKMLASSGRDTEEAIYIKNYENHVEQYACTMSEFMSIAKKVENKEEN